MSEGRILHLRCFMEGIEVPIVSCSVSAQLGGPASAHIELLDSELGFELLPRTLIHVFFFDDEAGTAKEEPNLFAGDRLKYDRNDRYTHSSRRSRNYKLLFCGELFSIFHNKSGYGSRNLTLMALDISNVLDTNYIFQVSYSQVGGAMGTGQAAEAQFVAAGSITNNPFDNIINSPQEVIRNMSLTQARSAKHTGRASRLGGLFSIFELLLGIQGYALGMNLWTSVHECKVRLLDMIESDSGKTAQKLFDQTIFNQWLTNSISNQAPSMSYRQLSGMIMSYIYYNMVSIPTASYYKPPGKSGREEYEIKEITNAVPSEYKQYFNEPSWKEAKRISPALIVNVVEVVKTLRSNGYPGTIITSGYRGPVEGDAEYGTFNFRSPHSKGIAMDIDWAALPNGSLFGLGNVAFSKKRSLAKLTAGQVQSLVDKGYVPESYVTYKKVTSGGTTTKVAVPGDSVISDARIMRFLLDYEKGQKYWDEAEPVLSSILFGGSIPNMYYFLHYMLCYPFMVSIQTIANPKWFLDRRAVSIDRYILAWRRGFKTKNFVAEKLLSNRIKHSMWRGMKKTNPAHIFMSAWVQKPAVNKYLSSLGKAFASSVEFRERFVAGGNLERRVVTFTNPGGFTDTCPFEVGKYGIGTSMGLHTLEHIAAFNSLIHDYYELKVKFWKDKAKAVDVQSAKQEPKMFSGANKMILGGKPTFSPPLLFVLYDKDFGSTSGMGDDPVHIQTQRSFRYKPEAFQRDDGVSKKLYESRERVTGFLVRPDIWMCAPPKCNVIFPDDIVSLNISRELMRQTTRTFLMTYDELYADNVIFNGHYFAPQFDNDIQNIQKVAFGISTSNEVIYPHEVYSGIIPKVSRISEVSFYSRAVTVQEAEQQVLSESQVNQAALYSGSDQLAAIAEQGSAGIYDYVQKYASDVAHFNLMKQRYSANRITITSRFLPMLVPGLPAVVIGQKKATSERERSDGFSSTHTWLGMIQSVQHSYNQGGATTSVSMETCRPYKTGKNSIDELLKLKKPGQNLFRNQDPSFRQTFTTSTKNVPSSLTFASGVTLPNRYNPASTPLETILHKTIPNTYIGFPGDYAFDVRVIAKDLNDILQSSKAFDTVFLIDTRFAEMGVYDPNASGQVLVPINSFAIRRRLPKSRQSLRAKADIGYVPTGAAGLDKTYAFGLRELGTIAPGYTVSITYYSHSLFRSASSDTTKIEGSFSSQYEEFNTTNMNSRTTTEKDIATANAAIANKMADLFNDILDGEDLLIQDGDAYKKMSKLTPKLLPEPVLGYITYTFDVKGVSDVVNRSFYNDLVTSTIESTGKPYSKLSDLDLATTVLVDLAGNAFIKIPVLLAAERFFLKVEDSANKPKTASLTKALNERSRPLEEALMPAWMDDEYKNGDITDSTAYQAGKATINSDSGIGSLYRKWFNCDSIVDGVRYNQNSTFSTVTIEEAVDRLINKYASGDYKGKGAYRYTLRNIANITDMLAPITESVSDKIPQTGGFHSRAIGDFDNLERLGIVGEELRGSLATNKKVTISALNSQQKDEGLSIDPRKERRKRVILYRNDVTKNRGKQG